MEPALRGSVEKIIDINLDDESLMKKYQILRFYKEQGVISSVESALFGAVWNNVITVLVDVKARAKQDISESEMEEFRKIFASRALEIRSKISDISNL
jgi:hypothetical protein